MQEFRRPEWSAYFAQTEKVLTDLAENDLLLLATVLSAKELEEFYILGRSFDNWKKFMEHKELHRPLNFQRGVKCPELTKVKPFSGITPVSTPPAATTMSPPAAAISSTPAPAPAPAASPIAPQPSPPATPQTQPVVWSAHSDVFHTLVTDLSENDILLLVTALTPKELEGFWILNPAMPAWKKFIQEKYLHRPLVFQRPLKAPPITQVKKQPLAAAAPSQAPAAPATAPVVATPAPAAPAAIPQAALAQLQVQAQALAQEKAKLLAQAQANAKFHAEVQAKLNAQAQALAQEKAKLEAQGREQARLRVEAEAAAEAKTKANKINADQDSQARLRALAEAQEKMLKRSKEAQSTAGARLEMVAVMQGQTKWSGKIVNVHWPLLIFDTAIDDQLEFFNVTVKVFEQSYLLMMFRGDEIRQKMPKAAMVLPSADATYFEDALKILNK